MGEKIMKTEENKRRDATKTEKMAYHYLEIAKICDYPNSKFCFSNCPFAGSCIMIDNLKENCRKELSNKKVYFI